MYDVGESTDLWSGYNESGCAEDVLGAIASTFCGKQSSANTLSITENIRKVFLNQTSTSGLSLQYCLNYAS